MIRPIDNFDDPERDRPGDDISGDSMDVVESKSTGCPFCSGGGWATIFHMDYTGEAVIEAFDGYHGYKRKVMRTVAHCVCAAGRKMLFQHKESSKEAYIKVADLNEVVAGRHPEWQTDDPTYEDSAEVMTLERLNQMIGRRPVVIGVNSRDILPRYDSTPYQDRTQD